MQNHKQKKPGIHCPECNFLMDISMTKFIRQDNFICAGCGLQLSANSSELRDLTEADSPLHTPIKGVENIKHRDS